MHPTHRILHTEELVHIGGRSEKDRVELLGSVHNLTRQEEKEEERKCVLLASQPEHLSPPGKDRDSVVEP